MTVLELPDTLKGLWDHALILTYGADIPFYEQVLSRQFASRCRNKIILMDGRQYLDACAHYAEAGLVRHLNQRYVVEGIFVPHAAHAKIILLANPDRGRLLVGSGNLGWQGYASGGEIFTRYEYDAAKQQDLPAFVAVRELVEHVLGGDYVGVAAQRHLGFLLEETPWLFAVSPSTERPVRHNLTRSFVNQLREAIGDETVEELWVLSPFYDQEAAAAEHLLDTFAPHKMVLLLQPRYASADPASLQRLIEHAAGRCHVQPFTVGDERCYAHAKMYFFKMANRAVCLQGSPNLSRVAMLASGPSANIEVANLMTGARHAFDHILEALTIGPAVETLDALELSYRSDGPTTAVRDQACYLMGGEWSEDRLALRYAGVMPDLEVAHLIVDGHTFPLVILDHRQGTLIVHVAPDVAGLLARPVPVSIDWGDGDSARTSNPIIVCNKASLNAMLDVGDATEALKGAGSLDLDDSKLEELFDELEASLVLDQQSVWTLTGHRTSEGAASSDEIHIDYAAIDYDALRQHPRMQQYLYGSTGRHDNNQTKLQIILNSITDHLAGLSSCATPTMAVDTAIEDAIQEDVEAITDRDGDVEDRERYQRTQDQRRQRIIKRFVGRYLRSIHDPDFQTRIGHDVMTTNYIIFPHILWRLLFKGWVDPEYVTESLLNIWQLFWGSKDTPGYLSSLHNPQIVEVNDVMRKNQADARLFAALYYVSRLTRAQKADNNRLALRDVWRNILQNPLYQVTAEVLEDAWFILARALTYDYPFVTGIVEELSQLASYDTRTGFIRDMEAASQLPSRSWTFEKARVRNPPSDALMTIDCLVLSVTGATLSNTEAIRVLQGWMRFEEHRYYRIASPDNNAVQILLRYDAVEQKGDYWVRGEDPLDISLIAAGPTPWGDIMTRLQLWAQDIDGTSVVPTSALASA